jgi:hypothetical protein
MSIANVIAIIRKALGSGILYADPTYVLEILPIIGKANPYWITAMCLSWFTNTFATSLIAYKAWLVFYSELSGTLKLIYS